MLEIFIWTWVKIMYVYKLRYDSFRLLAHFTDGESETGRNIVAFQDFKVR